MNNKMVIGLLAILAIVLVVLGLSLTSNPLNADKTFEREVTQVENVSESDEVSDIEMELESTNLDELDKEIPMIEAELN